jgi:hypothetical protein
MARSGKLDLPNGELPQILKKVPKVCNSVWLDLVCVTREQSGFSADIKPSGSRSPVQDIQYS